MVAYASRNEAGALNEQGEKWLPFNRLRITK